MRPTALALAAACLIATAPALADDEASNIEHTTLSADGHCTAKSTPAHAYDPSSGPRQEGRTEITRTIAGQETLIEGHDWFARRLFVVCGPGAGGDVFVVRVGPWARGRRPLPSHLALGFYRNGRLLKEYSNWDIAGSQEADPRAVSASVSHYRVLDGDPVLMAAEAARAEAPGRLAAAGAGNHWVIRVRTFDARVLYFEVETGRLR